MKRLILALAILTTPLTCSASAQQQSTICQFQSGPLAGTARDYAPMPPVPVGSRCWDGLTSYGQVVASVQTTTNMSTLCQFTIGQLAGQIRDYAPMPQVPVGVQCQDGAGSFGIVVPRISPPQNSRTCLFYSGPAQGKMQVFPNAQPAPIGTPCWDGVNNYGTAVADVPSNPYQSNWGGGGSAPSAQTPPPPNAPTSAGQQAPVPSATPLEIGKSCAISSGGNPEAMGVCLAQNLPANTLRQCYDNPGACFDVTNPVWGNIIVFKKAFEVAGIDIGPVITDIGDIIDGFNPF